MNCNNYTRIAHVCLWFGDKIALSKRLKPGFHQNFWQDCGGKVEKGESILKAAQRETFEESSFYYPASYFEFIDCFLYEERRLKTFLFELKRDEGMFKNIKNPEPLKQSDWKLFTIEESLKLDRLMPSVRIHLENLERQ